MNNVHTENGSLAYRLKNKCLALFSTIGGMIDKTSEQMWEKFIDAYEEDKKIATNILFYSRGARKGGGLRKIFWNIFKDFHPTFIVNNMDTIINNGYAKDIYTWLEYNMSTRVDSKDYVKLVVQSIAYRIMSDECNNYRKDLLLKWCPREGQVFKAIRDQLEWTNKDLRTTLASYVSVESLMSAGKWNDIDFNTVPGGALKKYKKAWLRNCPDNYNKWLEDKDSKASVSATYPHDIAKLFPTNDYGDVYRRIEDKDILLAQKMWDNLPNYLTDKERPIIMSDTSGSMLPDGGDLVNPMAISVSLGIYCSERMSGPFKDKIMTFSESPEFHDLSGTEGIYNKWMDMWCNDNWGMNTDFEAAYDLLLTSAKMWNVKPEDMPTMLICISDMQFDSASHATPQTILDNMSDKFNKAGYKVPKLVFWNVRASSSNMMASPVDDLTRNSALISGFNPSILEPVLKGEDMNPMKIMYSSLEHLDLDYTRLPLS